MLKGAISRPEASSSGEIDVIEDGDPLAGKRRVAAQVLLDVIVPLVRPTGPAASSPALQTSVCQESCWAPMIGRLQQVLRLG
jgi:hypothetical protein